MKKIYFVFVSLIVTSFGLKAQSLQVNRTSDGATINDNAVMYISAVAGGLPSETDFNFKNISASSKTYHVKRTDMQINHVAVGDTSEPYFCTGLNCYPSTTTITPTPITLNANGIESLKTYLQEASVEGISVIKYEIYNTSNTSDKITFTIQYNNPAGLKQYTNIFSSVSDVYPNPTNQFAKISVDVSVASNNNTLIITNALGAIVSKKMIDLSVGRNTIPLDVQGLNNGIYFVTLSNVNSKVIKKFTVTQ